MATSETVEPKTEKVCCDCKRLLPIEWFAVARAEKDGHQRLCRDCQSDRFYRRKEKGLIPTIRVGL